VYAAGEEGLAEHYLVRRDFDLERPEPNDALLTAETFSEELAKAGRQLKSVLVGKCAVVVGLSNSAFQDIIHRAGLHPKRKASELSAAERRALYDAMRFVVLERLRLGGKARFRDLYGRPGGYEPAMGPALKGRSCPACGSAIQKLALGGGEVFICPRCQPAG
jgi:formamidopyrimidine-DNA glycosylase